MTNKDDRIDQETINSHHKPLGYFMMLGWLMTGLVHYRLGMVLLRRGEHRWYKAYWHFLLADCYFDRFNAAPYAWQEAPWYVLLAHGYFEKRAGIYSGKVSNFLSAMDETFGVGCFEDGTSVILNRWDGSTCSERFHRQMKLHGFDLGKLNIPLFLTYPEE